MERQAEEQWLELCSLKAAAVGRDAKIMEDIEYRRFCFRCAIVVLFQAALSRVQKNDLTCVRVQPDWMVWAHSELPTAVTAYRNRTSVAGMLTQGVQGGRPAPLASRLRRIPTHFPLNLHGI